MQPEQVHPRSTAKLVSERAKVQKEAGIDGGWAGQPDDGGSGSPRGGARGLIMQQERGARALIQRGKETRPARLPAWVRRRH